MLSLLLVSLCHLASDTLVVDRAQVEGPYPLVVPYTTDTLNLSGKAFDITDLLKQNKPASTDASPAVLREVKADQPLGLASADTAAAPSASLGLFRFTIETPRYVKARLHIDKVKHYRILIDGNEATADLELLPGRLTVDVQFLTEAGKSDSLSVRLTADSLAGVVVNAEGKRPYTMADMLRGGHYYNCRLSPSGSYLLYSAYYRKADGGVMYTSTLTRMADGRQLFTRDGYLDWQWWPVGDDRLYFTRQTVNGRELVTYDPATLRETVLAEGIPDGSFSVSPIGDYLIYSLSDEGPAPSDGLKKLFAPDDRMPGWRYRNALWRYDLKTRVKQRLTYGSTSVYLSDISQDGKRLLLEATRMDPSKAPFDRKTILEMDAYTGKVDTLLSDTIFVRNVRYSPDAMRLLVCASPASFGGLGSAVLPDQQPNCFDYRLYLYDKRTRQTTFLLPDFAPSVENYLWAPGNGMIYFTATDGSRNSFFSLHPDTRRVVKYALETSSVQGFSVGRLQKKPTLVYFGQSAERAREMFVARLDHQSPKSERIGPLSFDETAARVAIGKCHDWKFCTSRGDSIDGFYFLPPRFDVTKSYPLIVYYYGGCTPSSQCLEFQYPLQVLAGPGYVVYVTNPSGCIGYGQEFAARHVNAWGQRTASDIIEGTKQFCAEHPFIDPARIGCMGASYGGFMTQYLQTQTDLFAAAISHAGISNIASYWGGGYWGYTYGECAQYGSFPWNNPKLYVEQSPLFQADKIHTPLLLLHGTVDTNVPTNESQQMYTALKILGREVAYVQVDGQDHVITDYKKRLAWQNVIFAWFAKYLKGEPAWWDSLKL